MGKFEYLNKGCISSLPQMIMYYQTIDKGVVKLRSELYDFTEIF